MKREFRSRLAEAARYSRDSGAESGFCYLRSLKTDQHYLTPSFKGVQDELPNDDFNDWKERYDLDEPDRRVIKLFDLHLHGGIRSRLGLSRSDIELVDYMAPRDPTCPVIGVGTCDDSDSVNVLL